MNKRIQQDQNDEIAPRPEPGVIIEPSQARRWMLRRSGDEAELFLKAGGLAYGGDGTTR